MLFARYMLKAKGLFFKLIGKERTNAVTQALLTEAVKRIVTRVSSKLHK